MEVEEGGREDTVDGAVQLSVADLWRETRIGEPREGIVCGAETEAGWREVYGRDGVWRVHREEWRAPATVMVIQCRAGNVSTANAWELAGSQGTVGKRSASSFEVHGCQSKCTGIQN